MCGITGYLDIKNKINIKILLKMNDVIKHRGPDDEGFMLFSDSHYEFFGEDSFNKTGININDAINEKYYLGFAHRRLSIIDTSEAGHQPMKYLDYELYITLNGEIYNYIEIREELISKGYKFKTECDTEVVLASYLEWGEQCVIKFNGMWSFCIYDKQNNKLFCSRDRFGQKPFHYFFNESKFIFGSELKQLCQDESIERTINEEVLSHALVYGITDYSHHTLIDKFFLLKPAHNLIINIGKDKLEKKEYRYWGLNMQAENMTDAEIYENVYRHFLNSVKLRLRSDVPVGALLSGGLDSSCMVTEIAKQIKDNKIDTKSFNTFTSCYNDDPKNDESYFAHIVNEHNKLSENFIYPDITNIEKDYEEIIWHIEGFGSHSFLGVDRVIKAASDKGIRVVLNGQNGDETMFGYERYYVYYFADLIKKLKFGKFFREFKLASKNSKCSLSYLIKMYLYFNVWTVRKLKNEKEFQNFLKNNVFSSLNNELMKKLAKPTNLNELIYNELTATQLPHILRYDDRIYMKNSIESRVPFIDYKYVELACKIDPSKKIQNGYTKYILRKIFSEKLPDEVVWRKNKMGFQAPTERWTSKYTKEYLDELTRNARSDKYFNMENIKKELHENINSKISLRFLNTEIFMRKFDVFSE